MLTQPPLEHPTGPEHEKIARKATPAAALHRQLLQWLTSRHFLKRKAIAAALYRYTWLVVVLFVTPVILYGWERGYWDVSEIKAVGLSVALSIVAVVAFELRLLRDQRERWHASTAQDFTSLRHCIVSCAARIETALYETRGTGVPADEGSTPTGERGEDEDPPASRDGLRWPPPPVSRKVEAALADPPIDAPGPTPPEPEGARAQPDGAAPDPGEGPGDAEPEQETRLWSRTLVSPGQERARPDRAPAVGGAAHE